MRTTGEVRLVKEGLFVNTPHSALSLVMSTPRSSRISRTEGIFLSGILLQGRERKTENSICVCAADVPLYGTSITGCIGAILYEGKEYRFATYLGAKRRNVRPGYQW